MPISKKNFAIEFWKIFFTCLVILLHYEANIGEKKYFACCYLAVEFFFILSGFFMAKHLEIDKENSPTKASVKYILLRYKQLYPAFLFSWIFIFCKIIFFDHVKISLFSEIRNHIFELSLLWILIPNCKIYNFFAWYISALIITSYFVYWLMKFKKSLFIGFIAPLSTILIYSYFLKKGFGLDFHWRLETIVMDGILRAFADISIGCVSFFLYKKIASYPKSKILKVFFSIIEFIVLRFLYSILIKSEPGNYDFVSIPMFIILIILEYSQFTLLSDLLNKRIFGIFSSACLGMYLNQGLVISLVVPFTQKLSMPLKKSAFILLVLCAAFGFLSYLLSKAITKILFLAGSCCNTERNTHVNHSH